MVRTYLYTTYLLVSFLALCAQAAPTRSHSPILLSRQNDKPFDGPKTVQTHNVTKVNGGSVVEDCTVTFTPIVVGGQNRVREDKKCTRLFVPDGQALPPPPPPPTSTGSSAPPATTSAPPATTSAPPDSTTSAPPTPDSTTSAPADVSTTSPDPANTTSAPSETTTSNGDATTTTDASASSSASSATTSGAGPESTPGGVVVLGPSSVSADQVPPSSAPQNGPTGTAQEANEGAPSPSSTNVEIPGKKFEVLPIGLGVFAGISVIALIVVGLVTYERTKYRKAFRQRRLAAGGAEMGYGGMSERR